MGSDLASSLRIVGAVGLALAGCVPDSVAPGVYGVSGDAAAPDPSTPDSPDGEAPPTSISDAMEPAADTGNLGDAMATPLEGGLPTSTVGCDLSGRWLVAVHEVATALGAQEASHEWLYFEMTQAGTALTVTKGLSCGTNIVGISAASANVECHKTWPAMLMKDAETGRTGTSQPTASGCAVSFAKFTMVVGATVPYYQDQSNALPSPSTQASSGTPGWEDWDNDGNPGYTMNVTGLATGQLYIATRRWNQWSGTVAAGSNTFTIPDNWNSESDLLGYNGSSLLTETSAGTKDNDASLHFVTFARLAPTQATGDDATICSSVRTLAPMLAPEATK
jgi:hypothetical protein